MGFDLAIDADLDFSIEIPGSRSVKGALTGSGKASIAYALEKRLFDAGRAVSDVLLAGRLVVAVAVQRERGRQRTVPT